MPRGFYPGSWDLLHLCHSIGIGDKVEKRNRLDSGPLLSEKTPSERNSTTLVDHLLTLITVMSANPKLVFDDDLVLDVVIGHAVRVGWQQSQPSIPESQYGLHKANAWDQAYLASPAD